jgi:VanZ family protein
MVDRRRNITAWVPVVAYMAAIFVLSSQSRLPVPLHFTLSDKLAHAAIYLGLALLVLRASGKSPLVRCPGPYAQSLILAALYGISDEFHQRFVPGRSADVLDWFADVLGAAIAIILVIILRKRSADGRSRHG